MFSRAILHREHGRDAHEGRTREGCMLGQDMGGMHTSRGGWKQQRNHVT